MVRETGAPVAFGNNSLTGSVTVFEDVAGRGLLRATEYATYCFAVGNASSSPYEVEQTRLNSTTDADGPPILTLSNLHSTHWHLAGQRDCGCTAAMEHGSTFELTKGE